MHRTVLSMSAGVAVAMATAVASACGSSTTSSVESPSFTGGAVSSSTSESASSSSVSSTTGGAPISTVGSLSMTVSGAVSGPLTLPSAGGQVYCNSKTPGHMEVAGSVNGTPGYALRINIGALGTVTLMKTSPNTVQVVFSDAGQNVWLAGNGSSANGTVTSNADGSGTIDTDLSPVQGSGSPVHVKGSWTCP